MAYTRCGVDFRMFGGPVEPSLDLTTCCLGQKSQSEPLNFTARVAVAVALWRNTPHIGSGQAILYSTEVHKWTTRGTRTRESLHPTVRPTLKLDD